MTSYEKRTKARTEAAATKAKENEMKEEKEVERKVSKSFISARVGSLEADFPTNREMKMQKHAC